MSDVLNLIHTLDFMAKLRMLKLASSPIFVTGCLPVATLPLCVAWNQLEIC